MLGIEKEDIPIVRKYSASKVLLFGYVRRVDKVRLSEDFLIHLTDYNAKELLDFLKTKFPGVQPRLLRTVNYIEKQKAKHKQSGLISYGYLRDYWNALYKVYGQLDKNLLYPSDLKVAHDRTIMMVKEKENAALSEKIFKATKKFERFEYTDKKTGLLITPCRNHTDLIKEGKLLDHCVGTYAKSVSEGRTCIFFIRRITEPDIPYFTLELKEGRVIQNRGYKNCDRTPQVVAFEKKWLKFIKGVMKNGKPNDSSAAT